MSVHIICRRGMRIFRYLSVSTMVYVFAKFVPHITQKKRNVIYSAQECSVLFLMLCTVRFAYLQYRLYFFSLKHSDQVTCLNNVCVCVNQDRVIKNPNTIFVVICCTLCSREKIKLAALVVCLRSLLLALLFIRCCEVVCRTSIAFL